MIIYKTINILNGKIYIGIDSRNDPNYLGSGKILHYAIKKYGKENFKKEILEECNSIEELNEREIYWISKLKSQDNKIGYNILKGGLVIKGENHPMKGKKHSNKTKEKISKSLMGRSNIGIKTSNKLIKFMKSRKGKLNLLYGKLLSPETKKKISDSLSKENHPFYDKFLSDEHRKNISLGRKKLFINKKSTIKKEKSEKNEYKRKTNDHGNIGKRRTKQEKKLIGERTKMSMPNRKEIISIDKLGNKMKFLSVRDCLKVIKISHYLYKKLINAGREIEGYKIYYKEDYGN